MNIFAVSSSPSECAKYLDNKRVNKMILETAQMLCTNLNMLGITTPYKSTHINHPCTVWVRSTSSNYYWTTIYFFQLLLEYRNRTNKVHACSALINIVAEKEHLFPLGPRTPFVNCTPYPSTEVHLAYKMLLSDKWSTDKRTPIWTVPKEYICTGILE